MNRNLAGLKQGDPVRVWMRNQHNRMPDGGYYGKVLNVARKYLTAEYKTGDYTRTVQVLIETGNDKGSWTSVRRPEDVELEQRRTQALQTIKKAGFSYTRNDLGAQLELLEELAGITEKHRDPAMHLHESTTAQPDPTKHTPGGTLLGDCSCGASYSVPQGPDEGDLMDEAYSAHVRAATGQEPALTRMESMERAY